jgi:hypothetical protein
MCENAAYPHGRLHKHLANPEEDRIYHRSGQIKLLHSFGILHTSTNQIYHTLHMKGGRAGQAYSTKTCITNMAKVSFSKSAFLLEASRQQL